MSKKLSVVVPTFNESGNVKELAKQVGEALQGIDYNIWFIELKFTFIKIAMVEPAFG